MNRDYVLNKLKIIEDEINILKSNNELNEDDFYDAIIRIIDTAYSVYYHVHYGD